MSTREGGRRIKVEVRGLPEARHMLMYISERMNKVRDLGIKLKYVCDDIKKTDEIKIFRNKFLLPDNENINIIKTGEEIIVYRKATEYIESTEEKYAQVIVREEVLKENENKLKMKEMELQGREVTLKDMEDTLRKKEERLKFNEKNLDLVKEELMSEKKILMQQKEDYLDYLDRWLKVNEDNLREEDLKKMAHDLKNKENYLSEKEKHLNSKEKEFYLKLDDFNVKTEKLKEDLNVKTDEVNFEQVEINENSEQTVENLMIPGVKRKALNPDAQSKKHKNNIGPVKTSSIVELLQQRIGPMWL